MNNKCELCNAEADVFCPSDAAFLCCSCDAKVHQANFIVARHVRRPICSDSDSDSHSTITSSLKRPRNSVTRAEAILFNWCYKLGIEDGTVVRTACRTMRSVDRWTGLPFRVSLAASMWVSLGKSAVTLKVLKRLEVISGVPAKVILASGCKLERAAVEQRCPVDLEEGWAEC